jgi:hypothetical protein
MRSIPVRKYGFESVLHERQTTHKIDVASCGAPLSGPGLISSLLPYSIEPALGTYGNLGRNQIVGSGFGDEDRSLVKTTPIYKDRVRAQFCVEMLNVFNRTNLSPPNSNSPSLGDDDALGESTSSIGFRQRAPGIGSGEPYNTQLALKILF